MTLRRGALSRARAARRFFFFSAARRFREVLSAYEAQKDLILIGAYKKGSDPRTDLAIAKSDAMNAFLRETPADKVPATAAVNQLQKMF